MTRAADTTGMLPLQPAAEKKVEAVAVADPPAKDGSQPVLAGLDNAEKAADLAVAGEPKVADKPEQEEPPAARRRDPPAPVPIGDAGLMPTDMDGLWRLANMVFRSRLCPREYETPEAVCVAMAHGLEIGLPPMQSMQRIAVINGRPSVWGDAIVALIQRSGTLADMTEYFEGTYPGPDFRAVCIMKRLEGVLTGRTRTVQEEYSIEDAKIAGLWGKKGPWTTNPKRMLKMRARSFAARDLFADVLGGLYTAEEMMDIVALDGSSVVPAPADEQPEQPKKGVAGLKAKLSTPQG